MIHLHRTMAFVVACFLCTPLSVSQAHAQAADTAMCHAYMDSVKLFSQRYDANDSLRYFASRLLTCSEETQNPEGKMEALSVLGVTYIRENNFAEAMRYFNENRQLAIELHDTVAEAQVLINIGSVYTALDSTKKAMETLLRSAKLFEGKKDSSMLSYVYTNIGILFGKIREREEQLGYSKKAFAMGGGVIKDRKTLTLASNLAVNYLNSEILDTAETLGLEILAKSREFGTSKTTTQILNHLANISNRKEDYQKTIEYVNEVLSFEGILKHDHTFSSALHYRGIAYLKLGKVQQSVADFEQSLAYAKNEHSLQRTESVLKQIHLAYAAAGKFEDAYRYMVEYKNAADTLASEENIRILNELETKYETEKKEQQLRDLAQQNQISELKVKQRNIWIIVLIVIALLVAGTIYFVSRQRLLKQERETLENRLLSLRVQLNPHFIFNALTAVQNYMLGGKDLREAVRYLSNFAKVMRAFLEYNQEEQITLDKELNALELYVGIQKLRFSNGFEFDVEIDDQLIPEEVQVPPMILQPLIENAIEHGIRNMDNGKITLKYELEGDRLIMKLSDNGIGRKRAAEEGPKVADKKSLATVITEERISLLNRQGKGKYSLEIRDANEDGSGTEVIFKIPFTQT
ncbi:MAG: histidine kinase [Flavobacteriales bacterium]|nr:histidine kinase [Flavobacteriales bacterium]